MRNMCVSVALVGGWEWWCVGARKLRTDAHALRAILDHFVSVCLALSALVVSHMSLLSALIARLCRVGIKLYMYCAAVMDVAAACVGEHRHGKQATQAMHRRDLYASARV